MDRRFAFAILLSFLVLMVFQVWLAPKHPQAPEPGAADSLAAAAAAADSDSARAAVAAAGEDRRPEARRTRPTEPMRMQSPALVSPVVQEETVTLGSTLFKATFTNRGGRLLRYELNTYDKPSGGPVQMVGSTPELGLTLETEQGLVPLDDVLFSTRQATVDGRRSVIFEAGMENGLRVEKIYRLPDDGYDIDLQVRIQGAGDVSDYLLTWRDGIPPSEGDHKQFRSGAGALALVGKDVTRKTPGSFKNEHEKTVEGNVQWAGVRTKYFMSAIVPPSGTSSRVVLTGSAEAHVNGVEVAMPILQGTADDTFLLYVGPLEYNRLKALGHGLENGVELSYKFIRPISKLLLVVMVWMHGFLPNYGIIIIVISALTKILFYPLTKSSIRSMKAMQRLQPEMQAIRDKYKSDPQRMQKETMELYKTHKVNPLGGCLPMILQMPVFFALYAVLANSITMRQSGFVWWITDLSIPDTVGMVGGFAIHVLPVIMFFTTVAQQKVTPVTDPRQKMMGYMMPVVMLFIFYSFPAGLNLYWTVNNVLTVAQQWNIHREPQAALPAAGKA